MVAQRAGDLVRRQELDLRLRGQDALDEIGLETGEHGRHEHDHADADGDAADDEQGLQPSFAEKTHRGDPFERIPAIHGSTGRTCWPLTTPEFEGIAMSFADSPSTIST